MKVCFTYSIDKEYDNFKRSFNSLNHAEGSPRQQAFFEKFPELTKENSRLFVEQYIREQQLDMDNLCKQIESQWRPVEQKFFERADNIFKTTLPIDSVTAYLTIHDRCSYSFEDNEFFIHTHLPATNKTIMHELWHWYFYYTAGVDILTKHGRTTFNTLKEALTVLLNVEFADLLGTVQDKGYPQHVQLREEIEKIYRETNDVYKTIERTLTTA